MRQKANNLPANSQSHSRRRCRCRRWRRLWRRRLCRKWPVVVSLQCCNCCKRTWKFVIRLCGWKEKKTGYKSLQLHTNTIAHRLKKAKWPSPLRDSRSSDRDRDIERGERGEIPLDWSVNGDKIASTCNQIESNATEATRGVTHSSLCL